jgi:hypothetical protein
MIELNDGQRADLQEVFLEAFLDGCAFDAGTRALQALFNLAEGDKKQQARTVVGMWLTNDEEFVQRYEKAKITIERLRYAAAEDFLNRAGTGKQDKVGNAEVVAAHMLLEGYDRLKWSAKAPVVTKKQKNTPRIEFHNHPGRLKKDGDGDPN